MPLPSIDSDYLLKFLVELLNTPSPTGYAHPAIAFTRQALAAFPELQLSQTHKGSLVAAWPDRDPEHVMVRAGEVAAQTSAAD